MSSVVDAVPLPVIVPVGIRNGSKVMVEDANKAIPFEVVHVDASRHKVTNAVETFEIERNVRAVFVATTVLVKSGPTAAVESVGV